MVPYLTVQGTIPALKHLKNCHFWPRVDILWRHCDVTNRHGGMGVIESRLPMPQLWYHTNGTLCQCSGDQSQPWNTWKSATFSHFGPNPTFCDVRVTSLTVMDQWGWVSLDCQCPGYDTTPIASLTSDQVNIQRLSITKNGVVFVKFSHFVTS